MSNKPQDDYDPHFEAELEKAKALSLETLALEQFKQKRRLSSLGTSSTSTISSNYASRLSGSSNISSSSSNNGTTGTTTINDVKLREYKQQLEKRIGRPLSGGSVDIWKQTTENNVPRRVSEISPPCTSKDIPDLMDFNAPSPTKPKDPQSEAHDNFKQLVADMHKLNTQLQDVRSVMGPQQIYAAPRIQPPAAVATIPTYGFQTPAQMQIVPYNPTQVAQLYPSLPQTTMTPPVIDTTKKPLTPDELQRLYNLNHAVVPHHTNVVHPGYAANSMPVMNNYANNTAFYGSYSSIYSTTYSSNIYPQIPTNNTGAAPKLPPRQSVSGPQNYQHNAPPAIPPRVSSPSISLTPSNPSALPQSNSTGSINSTTEAFLKAEGIQLRKKSRGDQRSPSGDLIDLSNGADDSRVSVLEAFDPLFIGDRSSSEDDKGNKNK